MMSDFLVQRLTAASRKTFVGRFLNKGMIETVTRFTIVPRLEDQAGFTQAGQGGSKVNVTCACNCFQQRMGELTPDDGRYLSDVLGTS